MNDNIASETGSSITPQSDFAAAAPRGFLHGALQQLSQQTVATLHQRFDERITGLVSEAFAATPDDITPEKYCGDGRTTLGQAARDHALACSRMGIKLKAQALAQDLQPDSGLHLKTAELLRGQKNLEAEVADRLTKRSIRAEKRNSSSLRIVFQKLAAPLRRLRNGSPPANPVDALPWNEQNRIYFKLNDQSQSPVESAVTAYLTAQGYTITDYRLGRALDDRRNERKIGRLLKDSPGLLQAYDQDPARGSQKLMVVLTRNVLDLANGSVSRGWESCRTDAWSAARNGVNETQAGVIAAYLVSEDDPEIHRPFSRINIKPYDRLIKKEAYGPAQTDRTDTIYAPFNPIGLHHPGFVDAMYRFVDERLNGEKTGTFHLRDGCESYQEFKTRRLLPKDAVAALKELKVSYSEAQDGTLHVDGDLEISDFGLMRLPDFSRVRVSGHVNLSKNRLLTLEGAPQTENGMRVAQNLLVCFAGAPANTGTMFDYSDNHWLMTTLGVPQARQYRYGNTQYGRSKNHDLGHTPVCPTQEPERFPGFKRRS